MENIPVPQADISSILSFVLIFPNLPPSQISPRPRVSKSSPPQGTLRAVIIKKHLCLPWARRQGFSSFLAQGKHRSFLIMIALSVSCHHHVLFARVLNAPRDLKTAETAAPHQHFTRRYPWSTASQQVRRWSKKMGQRLRELAEVRSRNLTLAFWPSLSMSAHILALSSLHCSTIGSG